MVQLAGDAREVFGSQLDRQFVHGFTICGNAALDLCRIWSLSLQGMDIHNVPERFVKVLADYKLMTDATILQLYREKREPSPCKKTALPTLTNLSLDLASVIPTI